MRKLSHEEYMGLTPDEESAYLEKLFAQADRICGARERRDEKPSNPKQGYWQNPDARDLLSTDEDEAGL